MEELPENRNTDQARSPQPSQGLQHAASELQQRLMSAFSSLGRQANSAVQQTSRAIQTVGTSLASIPQEGSHAFKAQGLTGREGGRKGWGLRKDAKPKPEEKFLCTGVRTAGALGSSLRAILTHVGRYTVSWTEVVVAR